MESMKAELASLKIEISDLRNSMKDSTKYIEILSSQVLITSHVTEKLRNELDRLDQYSRRNSLVIRGIPAKPRESVADVEKKVKEVITQMDLSFMQCFSSFNEPIWIIFFYLFQNHSYQELRDVCITQLFNELMFSCLRVTCWKVLLICFSVCRNKVKI